MMEDQIKMQNAKWPGKSGEFDFCILQFCNLS
jgi:hypothetical protein